MSTEDYLNNDYELMGKAKTPPEQVESILREVSALNRDYVPASIDETEPSDVPASLEERAARLPDNTCGHVPARPDVDLTLCWICGIEIIPDPDTHLWRPLTAAEKLVKSEIFRKLRDLFFDLHISEFQQVLRDRIELPDVPSIRLAESIMGYWVIVHGQSEDLAWSGSRWVPHKRGIPTGNVQVCNFATRDEALEYAKKAFPVAFRE